MSDDIKALATSKADERQEEVTSAPSAAGLSAASVHEAVAAAWRLGRTGTGPGCALSSEPDAASPWRQVSRTCGGDPVT
ncbi:hypothetical protein FQA47_002540 [Oryzias melastigma]|uniref:Uncharacterized protein n=1 Tax=Oryzias melastigma TaxID=30732 RepID=A0A834FDK3_ORYME|nr:hypothetical protein FQA47_002540 [Oryzias melastigma]